MNNNNWYQMQPHVPQNPNPPPVYATQYSQNPAPNPSPQFPIVALGGSPRPPGVEPSSDSYGGGKEVYGSVSYAHPQAFAQPAASSSSSGYYQDPSVALQNWAGEAFRMFGATLYATGATISPNAAEQLLHARVNGFSKKKQTTKKTKVTKVVQSVWCEVCKIECNKKEVLDKHKLGKKHQKNLDGLKHAIAPPPVSSGLLTKPIIGPQENPEKGKASVVQNTKQRAVEPAEELETKRRKVLECGADSNAVKMCTICNVVCNSELVFSYHLAGKKHVSMMKQHPRFGGVATTT